MFQFCGFLFIYIFMFFFSFFLSIAGLIRVPVKYQRRFVCVCVCGVSHVKHKPTTNKNSVWLFDLLHEHAHTFNFVWNLFGSVVFTVLFLSLSLLGEMKLTQIHKFSAKRFVLDAETVMFWNVSGLLWIFGLSVRFEPISVFDLFFFRCYRYTTVKWIVYLFGLLLLSQ